MRRMSKPSQNKAFSFILVCPTAYKGTPRARFVYSIKRKNLVFASFADFYSFKGFLWQFNTERNPLVILFYAVCTFLQPLFA